MLLPITSRRGTGGPVSSRQPRPWPPTYGYTAAVLCARRRDKDNVRLTRFAEEGRQGFLRPDNKGAGRREAHVASARDPPQAANMDSAFPAAVKEKDMDDLKVRRAMRKSLAEVLPETLEEAERLVASIERAVQRNRLRNRRLDGRSWPGRHSTPRALRDVLYQAIGATRRHAGSQ